MIIQWVIIGVFILIGWWAIQLEHHTKKYKIIIIAIIGLAIYFSMLGVFTSAQVDLTSPRGAINAVYVYFGWIGQAAANLWDIGVDTTHMVGNAIKIDDTEKDNDRR